MTVGLDSLLQAMDAVIREVEEAGASAFREGDQEKVERLLFILKSLKSMKDRLATLSQVAAGAPIPDEIRRRKRSRRAPKGSRTSWKEFRVPILQALMELGGTAKAGRVVRRVGQIMAARLNEYDRRLDAQGRPNWVVTASIARRRMVEEGLLRGDSPKGVWEITEEGQQYLERARQGAGYVPPVERSETG